jgi:hypothetical protein
MDDRNATNTKEDRMAQLPLSATGPKTEEAFVADRQRFWLGFTSFTFWVAAFIVILLILMTIFLV